ncbi:MAG: hypothetical protein V3W18_08630 [candidate division Zixibacteria bacterium]
MGTGFTIDSPLKVARYGISSVISLLDDVLIEQMRKFHSLKNDLPYKPIRDLDKDARANRITAYLELLLHLVNDQVDKLQSSKFEPGSEITRYFEMLPDSPLRKSYLDMCAATDPKEKIDMQDSLRRYAVPGSIDVNIMTKVDRDHYRRGKKLPVEYCTAMAALRGYANSPLKSSIIFSAGINQRLYEYMGAFDDFFPDDNGILNKKIILKVSDFRSAMIQGKYLAKRGLWISEYRIESGLNCGGHAFSSGGHLIGPILDDFKHKKTDMIGRLHEMYGSALSKMDRPLVESPHEVRVTMQGGIGTSEESNFLLNYFGVDCAGWGTPFLLVPEVTNVDDAHIKKLMAAGDDDVYLSDVSPLGVPFWNLRESASEQARRQRIADGKPGSPCPKGYAASNFEFSKVPICISSRGYQQLKLKQSDKENLISEKHDDKTEGIMVKSCICHDLAGGATLKNKIDLDATPAVCAGPNIVNFSKIASLEEMVSHIYGRLSLLTNSERPHMFIKELKLNIEHFQEEFQKSSKGLIERTSKYFQGFKENMENGAEYYRRLADEFSAEQKERFLRELDILLEEIESLLPAPALVVAPIS